MSGSNHDDSGKFDTDGSFDTGAADEVFERAMPFDIPRSLAVFAELPNTRSRERARLTRKLGLIVRGDTAVHFLNHTRKHLQQSDPQLYASIDASISTHPIFREFDRHSSTIWRWHGNRVSIKTTTSYGLHRLLAAIERGVAYDELPCNLVASPVDGNTLGHRAELLPRGQRAGSDLRTGPRKSKELRPECYREIAAHRAAMDAMCDDTAAAAYARAQGFIPVAFKDDTEATVHLVTARVPVGLQGYVPFPPDMTLEKLIAAAPSIANDTFSIPLDPKGYPVIAPNERIDLAQLVWLIANGHGDGLHRGNVLRCIAESAPPRNSFRWKDGDRRNCRYSNLTAGAR